MLTRHEIYTKAADLIRDETKFMQGTEPRDRGALYFCSLCVFSAISHVADIDFQHKTDVTIEHEIADIVRGLITPSNLNEFNQNPYQAAIRILETAAAQHAPKT